ncbi:hypothetical protein RDV89_14560 [Nocardioides zeae]|uniref:Glycerophosphoryl diester phosphodiesterase membrane domain-containing protein n=1 Tax=Nocardioides imazamoxiresistens TaxID=3231893 RepID=A0ABU3PYG6_9ACTN|nr:hypothetical protein [Nocardioides zeae]MDT9594303.1 hypothetical protein [Nocardioides zeae]
MSRSAPDVPPAPGAAVGPTRAPSPYARELAALTGLTPEAAEHAGALHERRLLHHQPGPVPLRPLALGDVLDIAFAVLRRNPVATLGAALVVSAAAVLVPVLVALLGGWGTDALTSSAPDAALAQLMESGVVLVGNAALGAVGGTLLGGLLAHVVHAAAVGQLITLDEAWRRTRGRRWAMLGAAVVLGLAVLVGLGAYVALFWAVTLGGSVGLTLLFGLVTVPLVVALLVWASVRVGLLTVTVVALERLGVARALARSARLTRRSFWRLFGILALTSLGATVATYLLAVPLVVVAEVAPSVAGGVGTYLAAGAYALATVVPSAIATAYVTCVGAVLYLDLRMRTEGYDVALRSGLDAAGAAR